MVENPLLSAPQASANVIGLTEAYQVQLGSTYRGVSKRLSHEDAEDALQNAAEAALRRELAGKLIPNSNMGGYLGRAIHNERIEKIRAALRHEAKTRPLNGSASPTDDGTPMGLESILPSPEPGPEAIALRHFDPDITRLHQALETLEPNTRRVLMLWGYDYSGGEIAALTQRKEANVRLVVHRGLHALRKAFSRKETDEQISA